MTHIAQRRTDSARLAADGSARLDQVARSVNLLLDGHLECHGKVTLLAGTTETSIKAPVFTANTVIVLVPTDAASAALSVWQQEATTRREVIVGHDAPGANAEFLWVAVG
jgi:hypothetical protein